MVRKTIQVMLVPEVEIMFLSLPAIRAKHAMLFSAISDRTMLSGGLLDKIKSSLLTKISCLE